MLGCFLGTLGGALVALFMIGLIAVIGEAMVQAENEAMFERDRRRLYRHAYAAEDLNAGDNVHVSTIQPEAYRVTNDTIEAPTGMRVHTVAADARRGRLVRLVHPDLIEI